MGGKEAVQLVAYIDVIVLVPLAFVAGLVQSHRLINNPIAKLFILAKYHLNVQGGAN